MALCKHMVRVPKRSEGHPEGTRSIGGLAVHGQTAAIMVVIAVDNETTIIAPKAPDGGAMTRAGG